jgi:hypothetical protein
LGQSRHSTLVIELGHIESIGCSLESSTKPVQRQVSSCQLFTARLKISERQEDNTLGIQLTSASALFEECWLAHFLNEIYGEIVRRGLVAESSETGRAESVLAADFAFSWACLINSACS